MKLKLNINSKMLLQILSVTIVVFAVTVGYISIKSKQQAYSDAKKLLIQVADKQALEIQKDFADKMEIVKTLASAFKVYDDMPESQWKKLFLDMYYEVFKSNTDVYKLWDSWELQYFDTTWNKDFGRFCYSVFRQGDEIKHYTATRSLDGDKGVYAFLKSQEKNMMQEPYWDEHVEEGEAMHFMTSLIAVMLKDDKYRGLVGFDIVVDKLQEMIQKIKPFDNTVVFLSSNDGIIVGHTNASYVGKNLKEISKHKQTTDLLQYIKDGEKTFLLTKDDKGAEQLLVTSPIQVGDYKAPWSLCLIVPKSVILSDFYHTRFISILVALIGLVILSFVIIFISKNISDSLKSTTKVLKKMSLGDIKDIKQLSINTGDEVELMSNSVNKVMDGMMKTANFASEIGRGNLNSEFKLLSDKDLLGHSLINMRDSLIKSKEEDKKRKEEDERYNWATKGQAQFAEILRNSLSNISQLSFNCINGLVNYLEVNQGAIFIVEEINDEKVLQLKSSIAYNRQQTENRIVKFGKELVGRCAFEKKTIYMTDIPKDYIHITSGMGTANPKFLLLVPLLLDGVVLGVLELSSFNKLEEYKIKFVEQLSESIAATISIVKVNQQTSTLLQKSKQQAEELASKEEEMRQNMEELQATQEEARKKEHEMVGMLDAFSSAFFLIEYDTNGTILKVNKKYADLFGTTPEQMVGKKNMIDSGLTEEQAEEYKKLWINLQQGIEQHRERRITINNKQICLQEHYYPILDNNTQLPYKVIKVSLDVSQRQCKEANFIDLEEELQKEQKLLAEYKQEILKLQEDDQKLLATNIKTEKSKKVVPQKTEELSLSENDAELITWNDKYSFGIDEIDNQHQQLVVLLNTMYSNLKQGKSKKEIKESLNSFIDFASYHLGVKEDYFVKFNYEKQQDAVKEYKIFVDKIHQFQTDYLSNKVLFLNDTMNYIKEWVYYNLLSNKKYVKLFKDNGL